MTKENDCPVCPYCNNTQAGVGQDSCKLLNAAFVLAGLAMMLNIRLSYSSAPYALIRFQLPENLFSVFVRRMASALELWCLPSMLLGNIMELALKIYYKSQNYTQDFDNNFNLKEPTEITIEVTNLNKAKATPDTNYYRIKTTNIPNLVDLASAREYKFWSIIFPSIITQWLNFLTYVILLVVYLMGGDQGHLTVFYLVIAISGFVFGINMVLVYAADWNYIPVYIVGENSFPIVTSFMHYITTLIFGNRRKWNSDFLIVYIDIGVAIIISLVAASVWTYAYAYYIDTQINAITLNMESITTNKGYKGTWATAKVTITNPKYTNAGPEDTGTCPGTTNAMTDDTTTVAIYSTKKTPHKVAIPIPKELKDKGITFTEFCKTTGGNGYGVPHTDPKLTITKDGTITIKGTLKYSEEVKNNKCIEINLNKAAGTKNGPVAVPYGHVFTETFDTSKVHWEIVSPTLMVIVGMGLVYAIYPGIAPGMIVPFYLIDKIEMVLLIATFFPPIIVATLQKVPATKAYSPKAIFSGDGMGGWREYNDPFWEPNKKGPYYNWFWHFFDLLMVIKISLATIFIYSLHYRESHLSRSIVNQPKMSTALSIIFYMCHEFLLAIGFPGIIGNNGSTYVVLPAQYIGALFMIFLAFYSEGYIIEYKSHDPAHWPTEGMWYLYGYYQLNPNFFIIIKFNVCSDGYCDFK
uniref:Theileria-specific sub-telomeric protein, putative n=1 Tax=Theileria annulata TaxID=5874 RepID=A0A3B0MHF4_THEAN